MLKLEQTLCAKSKHFWLRQRKRELSDFALQLVLDFGTRDVQHDGTLRLRVGPNEVRRAYLVGVDASAANGVGLVVTPDGTLVTCFHFAVPVLEDLRLS